MNQFRLSQDFFFTYIGEIENLIFLIFFFFRNITSIVKNMINITVMDNITHVLNNIKELFFNGV